MKKQCTNPITIALTPKQFELAAQMMRNVSAYLNQCQTDNNTKNTKNIEATDFEYSAFLEEY